MDVSDHPPTITLPFSIAGCSEHSGRYVAENILVDKPSDQASRWSGAHQSPNVKQWILLRLDGLSILKSITFGKFHKPHPCNMKEFKVYVGLTEDSMTEVLHSGLKNDICPETFAVRHTNRAGICFPTRFVKIIPLSAHGQSFHTSIWFVSLSGVEDGSFVEQARIKHDDYREAVVLRHVLKHLRQRRFLSPFNTILSRSGLQLEHPLVTALYDSIVLNGDWLRAEHVLKSASDAGLFTSYRHACQPQAQWTRLHGLDADGDAPCRRGGHAMCMDQQNGLIYLFGGWDGQRSLDDFWVYDVTLDTWRLLSLATSREQNGPGPRACHKMVFDDKTGSIYLLGRLGDGDAHEPADAPNAPAHRDDSGGERTTSPTPVAITAYCSEFYRYHTRGLDAGKWDLLYIDTASSGGPPLVFDHQMVMDSQAQMIYISGGRIVDGDWESCKYASLYSYNVRTGVWETLQASDSLCSHPCIPSRFGHSMVLEPKSHTLFIFAGQRDDKYLSDMYAYHIPSGTVHELFSNFSVAGGPDPCFTQRAVIDPELREIYVFSGLSRRQGSLTVLDSECPNWIYRYERPDRPGKWSKILPAGRPEGSDAHFGEVENEHPLPRYAHQVVYDFGTKTVYMHGGNAGLDEVTGATSMGGSMEDSRNQEGGGSTHNTEGTRENRLDDFWNMQLKRPAPESIVRKATYAVRQQQFREMCEDAPPVKALTFLQTEVSSVVNHADVEEAHQFQSLLSHLLTAPPRRVDTTVTSGPVESRRDSEPVRKRSRSDTLADSAVIPSITLAEGDQPMGDATVESTSTSGEAGVTISQPVVRLEVDPGERAGSGRSPPSPARFKQRTDVFETLLLYVNEDAKQPEKGLLELINTDGLDLVSSEV
ncbi:Muskelin N-terminus-domain-containing protein [Sparassis latifolia]